MKKTLLSIVSPVYKAGNIVSNLVARIKTSVSEITDNFEIILVCDGSPDDSWREIVKCCEEDERVVGIELSRNFGQHNAISAGLQNVSGEWVVVMDCDLQDRPEEIPNLYHKALEGWDIVRARRINRQDNRLKKLSSIIFHKVFDFFTGIHTDGALCNFGVYRKRVIDEYNLMPEKARSFSTLIDFLGFKSVAVDVQHNVRAEGKSSYNLAKLFKLTFDVIISNSNKPLRLAVELGFLMALVSFVLAIYNVFAQISGINTLPGFTTTVFSIWFVGGLLLFVIGILGLYIGKIFDQVKNRQLFVIRQILNKKQ